MFLRGGKEGARGTGALVKNGVTQNILVAVLTDSQSLCATLFGKSTDLDPSYSSLKVSEDQSLYNGFQDILIS